MKPPRGGHVVPWHQDGGADCRTLWVAFDDVDARVGGLQVLPGMHTSGRLRLKLIDASAPDAVAQYKATLFNARHHVYGVDFGHAPPTTGAKSQATAAQALLPAALRPHVKPYELPAGSAGMHHPLLPHGSSKNHTAHRWRRVLVLRYQPARGRSDFDKMVSWVPHYRTGRLFLRRTYRVASTSSRKGGPPHAVPHQDASPDALSRCLAVSPLHEQLVWKQGGAGSGGGSSTHAGSDSDSDGDSLVEYWSRWIDRTRSETGAAPP